MHTDVYQCACNSIDIELPRKSQHSRANKLGVKVKYSPIHSQYTRSVYASKRNKYATSINKFISVYDWVHKNIKMNINWLTVINRKVARSRSADTCIMHRLFTINTYEPIEHQFSKNHIWSNFILFVKLLPRKHFIRARLSNSRNKSRNYQLFS